MYDSDYALTCNTATPYVANTLNKIHCIKIFFKISLLHLVKIKIMVLGLQYEVMTLTDLDPNIEYRIGIPF